MEEEGERRRRLGLADMARHVTSAIQLKRRGFKVRWMMWRSESETAASACIRRHQAFALPPADDAAGDVRQTLPVSLGPGTCDPMTTMLVYCLLVMEKALPRILPSLYSASSSSTKRMSSVRWCVYNHMSGSAQVLLALSQNAK